MVTETNNEACAQLQLALERAQTDIGSWSKPPPDVALSPLELLAGRRQAELGARQRHQSRNYRRCH